MCNFYLNPSNFKWNDFFVSELFPFRVFLSSSEPLLCVLPGTERALHLCVLGPDGEDPRRVDHRLQDKANISREDVTIPV